MVLQVHPVLIPLLGSVHAPPSAMLQLACVANALTSVARRLATSKIDPVFLAPFVACRLIPLDKTLMYVQLVLVMFLEEFLQRPYFIV